MPGLSGLTGWKGAEPLNRPYSWGLSRTTGSEVRVSGAGTRRTGVRVRVAGQCEPLLMACSLRQIVRGLVRGNGTGWDISKRR